MNDKKITVYSTGCPKCKVLLSKLNEKGVIYDICSNTDIMINKGISQVPFMDINGELLNFKDSVNWINNK